MKQNKYFSVIYRITPALIVFIAVFFIAQRTLHSSLPMAISSAGIFAVLFYASSYSRGHASYEIKAIVAKYHLADEELAKIAGMKANDFPIYYNRPRLIIPKRRWSGVLDALQEYDVKQQNKLKGRENNLDQRE